VQTINVLGDHILHIATFDQRYNGHVGFGGPGFIEGNVKVRLLALLLQGPNALGSPEIRYACRCTDASSRVQDNVSGFLDQISKFLALFSHHILAVEALGRSQDSLVVVG